MRGILVGLILGAVSVACSDDSERGRSGGASGGTEAGHGTDAAAASASVGGTAGALPRGGEAGILRPDGGVREPEGGLDVSLRSDAAVDASLVRDASDSSVMGAGPLAPRVDNATCALPAGAGSAAYEFSVVYPRLQLARPIWVGTAPGEPNRLFVAEQGGAILSLPTDADPQRADLTEFLTLSVLRAGNEEGLLGLAFHPDYPSNGRFFVNYSSDQGCPDDGPRCSVIAEYRRSATDPTVAEPAESRLLVVSQPYSNHNGGAMAFGPDGYLYFSLGDGGSGGDPEGNGQNPSTVLGAISRIDVDAAPSGEPYGIPADNPFADGSAGAPEVWAWGFRNVWRFSFDRAQGTLWAGDVGQGCAEEIDRVDAPGNYGWNVREGFRCFGGCQPAEPAACPGDFVDPVWEYPRADGASVTGGIVYRGPELDELRGTYLFGDYVSRRLWSLRERSGQTAEVVELGIAGGGVSSFGEDAEGNVYLTTFDGRIRTIQRSDQAVAELPQHLSQTGCFADVEGLVPAPGVIPYDLNLPFWSDGATKRRWWALPAGQTASLADDGTFEFPVGTVFIKHFELEVGAVRPRRLETRLYVRQADGWRGVTYQWNSAQTDAELLDGAVSAFIQTPAGGQTWQFPSRAQCDGCHTPAAGHVLGFRTAQLSRPQSYGGTEFAQLDALFGAGYITDPAGSAPAYPVLQDESAALVDRARAYLDTNCAMCHQPTGPGNAQLDLRFSTPFDMTGTCDVLPERGNVGIADPRILVPGDPGRSVLSARIHTRGPSRMPPLASTVVDEDGAALVDAWIASLTGCP